MTTPARPVDQPGSNGSSDKHTKTTSTIDVLALVSFCLFGWLTFMFLRWYADFIDRSLIDPITNGQLQVTFSHLAEVLIGNDHMLWASLCGGSVFGLVAAIGLFLRAAWARIAFMAILPAVMLCTLAGLVGLFVFVSGDPYFCRGNVVECRRTQATMYTTILIALSLVELVICRSLSKTLRVLRSAEARLEFNKNRRQRQST